MSNAVPLSAMAEASDSSEAGPQDKPAADATGSAEGQGTGASLSNEVQLGQQMAPAAPQVEEEASMESSVAFEEGVCSGCPIMQEHMQASPLHPHSCQ